MNPFKTMEYNITNLMGVKIPPEEHFKTKNSIDYPDPLKVVP